MSNNYQSVKTFDYDNQNYRYFSFETVAAEFNIDRLPFSIKILLENLLRHSAESFVTADDIKALANWDPLKEPDTEIGFVPSRVILQDFTGVPAVVDLATMRDAMNELGGDPEKINPLSPAELVIDHSVMVDYFGSASALEKNTELEVKRNLERYQFLKWGQKSFDNLKVVPPGTGIVHQVNLEYLARTVFSKESEEGVYVYPDSLVGTDSHTTMINGLGVLGWGVGGIEAEAAMLGQPISMLVPQVVGFRLIGKMPAGSTATDLVLTVTQILRKHGVVGKFVEFFGNGLRHLSLADRATIANMAPEYGATCGLFHIDDKTLDYLRLTGRSDHQIGLIEHYLKANGMWHDSENPGQEADFSSVLELDLGTVVPSIAGPKRPQDRIALTNAKQAFENSLTEFIRIRDNTGSNDDFADEGGDTAIGQLPATGAVETEYNGEKFILEDGAVVLAAITSCTNTSNPEVLVTAGLLARNARTRGLTTKPWVKTSLAPGSKVVTDYLEKSALMDDLEALGFYLVGYGCTTCIGNSGPLPTEIENAIQQGNLVVSSVLSGNRNFEGRIHARIRNNYLASPPLVVAYALAGTMQKDLTKEAIGEDTNGNAVYLEDIWPKQSEVAKLIANNINADMFREKYADVYQGPESWQQISVSGGSRYDWPASTYIKKAPFFDGMDKEAPPVVAIEQASCLVKVGDSITTDHISPAGAIDIHSPAGIYLKDEGVNPTDFNSYGSRRGNHEVMVRGTFANVRLKNQLAPGTEGSWTTHFPSGEVTSIYDASQKYLAQNTSLVVLAGKEYGTGSSRDWAAKGTSLLGIKAVIAQSFERIHRSNLVGMGVLPLQFPEGDSADSLGLDGKELFTIAAITPEQKTVTVNTHHPESGAEKEFEVMIRIDTPNEFNYYQNGGILHYVLRKLAG